jgi:predicted AlkP superfamily pyrophosphatase or phosphodiesterase
MKRCWFTFCFCLLVISLGGRVQTASAAPAGSTIDRDRIVVLMSIDGLANFYMDDRAAEIPTIRKLAAEGARAASMRASDPTVTWPNHTTLVTGVSPAKHGVLGNNYFDRVKSEKITLIWDPALDKDEIVKVPTIYDVAKSAGYKTAAIHWPATRNARSLDWTSPDVGKAELVSKYTTPELLKECKDAGYHVIYGNEGKTISRTEGIDEDNMWTNIFNMILHKHRPNLGLLHVLAVDHTQHYEGPRSPGAYAAIKAADGQVRQVWEELQKDFPRKATLIIVSDHGFSLNKTKVSPSAILEKAGLADRSKGKENSGPVQLVVQGGSIFVYISDDANRETTMRRVKQAFANVDGVDKIVSPSEFAAYGIADPKRDPHAPDMVVFAKMGYFFGDTAAGAKKEMKGSHGYDSHLPDLHAVFVACGTGIKPDIKLGEIDNKSVAPTIAKLLGVEIPNADGKPLVDALAE